MGYLYFTYVSRTGRYRLIRRFLLLRKTSPRGFTFLLRRRRYRNIRITNSYRVVREERALTDLIALAPVP